MLKWISKFVSSFIIIIIIVLLKTIIGILFWIPQIIQCYMNTLPKKPNIYNYYICNPMLISQSLFIRSWESHSCKISWWFGRCDAFSPHPQFWHLLFIGCQADSSSNQIPQLIFTQSKISVRILQSSNTSL